eukprot:3664262-Prymnesium_polylepis.2
MFPQVAPHLSFQDNAQRLRCWQLPRPSRNTPPVVVQERLPVAQRLTLLPDRGQTCLDVKHHPRCLRMRRSHSAHPIALLSQVVIKSNQPVAAPRDFRGEGVTNVWAPSDSR